MVPAVLHGIENDDWVHYRNFASWSYEGGNIARGLWMISHATKDSGLETFLHSHLNYFQEDPEEFGFRILQNESLTYNESSIFFPWLYSIGDNIGLFPVVYGDRLRLAEDRDGLPYVKGLREIPVSSADEAYQVLMTGRKKLHFAATKLNQQSSRSH